MGKTGSPYRNKDIARMPDTADYPTDNSTPAGVRYA
jgi:hypothetical protein